MGMSRLAAAFFNESAPVGWQAVSAGLEPGESLSPSAARLLAGTSAAPFLDRAAPRPIDSVPMADRVIAIRNPSIQFNVPGAETWDLISVEFDEHLRDEIRERVQGVTDELG